MKNKKGITLIALIITIIVMLILVGVTVTVSINGGLFEKTKEAAKGTTIEKTKEQIIADIAVKIADKSGTNITENELKEIVAPKYGTLNEDETALILTSGEEVPLSEIWNNFDGPQKNEYGYYTNCLYGTAHIEHPEYFTEEQLAEFEKYYQTKTPVNFAANNKHKNPTEEWLKSSELKDYDIGDSDSWCILLKENTYIIYLADSNPAFASNENDLIKENGKVYKKGYYPFFFSEDGKTIYMYNEGS